MKRLIAVLVYGCLISCQVIWAGPIHISTFNTYSRLTLKMDRSTPVEIQNLDRSMKILLLGQSFVDLGIPEGQESLWKSELENLTDFRVEKIDFQQVHQGTQIEVYWRFPKGEFAPARPKMENFAYYDELRSQYVIDFWIKSGLTQAQLEATHRRNRQLRLIQQAQAEDKKRQTQKAIQEKVRYEAQSFLRFCEQPSTQKNDIFLAFLPIHEKVNFARWFSNLVPDQNFVYSIPKEKNREAQYIRLIHSLAEQGNLGLALRTVDFFDKEFSRSSFRPELRFFRANALMKLGHVEAAETILNELANGKQSEVSLQSSIYLAQKLMQKKYLLPALERYTWIIQNYPNHKLNWVFHLGAAECLYGLKQTSRAGKEYRWIIENAKSEDAKGEALFRLGDLYLDRFQYEQALLAYFQGYKNFPEQAKKHPSYFLNRAEALYQLEQYPEARQAFELFLKDYPNYPEGWRATFRLGEIAARVEAEPHRATRARTWFYQTINSFPITPGALLARLRLLPCEDHGGYNLTSMKDFFEKEVQKFDAAESVQMDRYKDFHSLVYVRALMSLGSIEQVTDAAIEVYWKTKNLLVKELTALAAGHFFVKNISNLLKEGKKLQALMVYENQFQRIPKSGIPTEDNFLIHLSLAASDLGLGQFGEKLFDEHATKIREVGLVAGNDSEANFSRAKAIWMTTKRFEHSAEIRKLLDQVGNESRFAFEKEIILGLLDEKEGKVQSAIGHAARAQLLARSPRVDAWLADLEIKAGDLKSSLELYRKLELNNKVTDDFLVQKLGVLPVPDREIIILNQAAILEKQKNWGEAAATYARAMEKGWGGIQMEFQYAKMLLKSTETNDRVRAHQTLEKLVSRPVQNESEGVWRRLAQETLEDERKKVQ